MCMMYSDITSCVINNCYATSFFKIQCITVTVGETEFKICQLANDTTCFLSVEKSGYEVLNIIQNFKNCSGLKSNLNKTEAL